MDIIDFHAHILPGLDHGCRDLETALSQLRLAAKNGTAAIVATSHFEPHNETVDAFLLRRARAVETLIPHLSADMPRIYLGAEVLLCRGMQNMPSLSRLAIEGTDVLLLERPFLPLDRGIAEAVHDIAAQGFTAVLAHIDRYSAAETRSILYPNVYAQLNSVSMRGFFARKRAMPFLRDGKVVAFGSDLHGASPRYNRFSDLPRLFPSAFADVMANTAALLENAIPIA